VAVTTKTTLEEFLSNPDIHYYDFHELHNGEVAIVSPPSLPHVRLQRQLDEILHPLLSHAGYWVAREFYYTLTSNSRRADIAVVSEPRVADPANKVFRGGPDLVIEILSSSNYAEDLDRLRVECFAEGTQQFWIVNATFRTVTVYRPRYEVDMYGGDEVVIPLDEFVPGAKLPVADIFK
jgi:Uma2 family endonuclease